MYNYFSKLLFIYFLFLLSMNVTLSKEKKTSDPLFSVVVSVDPEKDYKLVFKLSNNSGRSLIFSKELFSRASLSLIVVKDAPFSGVLEELVEIGEPSLGFFELSPGDEYFESIDLEGSYPSLVSDLYKNNLIIYWNTVIKTGKNEMISERKGGYIFLESTG